MPDWLLQIWNTVVADHKDQWGLAANVVQAVGGIGALVLIWLKWGKSISAWISGKVTTAVLARKRVTIFPISPNSYPTWSLVQRGNKNLVRLTSYWNVKNISDGEVHLMTCRIKRPQVDGLVRSYHRYHRDTPEKIHHPAWYSKSACNKTSADFEADADLFPETKNGRDIVVTIVFVDQYETEYVKSGVVFKKR